MTQYKVAPTGVERFFSERDLIVSKTDTRGRITYANNIFRDIAGFSGKDLENAPHSLIRHPDMPRCVFKLLWDTIGAGGEIFAYVINMSANGDHYWVLAHVTPSYDESGSASQETARSFDTVSRTITEIEEITGKISAVSAKQSEATRAIQENVAHTVRCTERVTGIVGGVSENAATTRAASRTVLSSAETMNSNAGQLTDAVAAFFQSLKKGPLDHRDDSRAA